PSLFEQEALHHCSPCNPKTDLLGLLQPAWETAGLCRPVPLAGCHDPLFLSSAWIHGIHRNYQYLIHRGPSFPYYQSCTSCPSNPPLSVSLCPIIHIPKDKKTLMPYMSEHTHC